MRLKLLTNKLFKSALFFLFFACFHSPVSFGATFPAEYDVTYTIHEDGKTGVKEVISITNETDNQYPAQYTLAVEDLQLENIRAQDGGGELRIETEQKERYSLITVFFNEIVVGKGSRLTWTLEYEAHDIARKQGQMWEVRLPQVQQDEQIQSYRLAVIAPESLGPLNYADPPPHEFLPTPGYRTFVYTFNEVRKPIVINLTFGTLQLVTVDLTYHLHNPLFTNAISEIALPPSTPSYQRSYIQRIEPEPNHVYSDVDGNILAQYTLAPGEYKQIRYTGQVILRQKILTEQTNGSQIQNSTYVKEDTFWEVNHNLIQTTLAEVIDQSQSTEEQARAIYSYVTNTLTYDTKQLSSLEDITRSGALAALRNPDESICTDFTDATIALMRAAGIPAREINGYAFTDPNENLPTITDILHAWVQIYLPERGWVHIDPTWGSTSGLNYFDHFDTNHVVFVIKGNDSEYPYPAGSYKLPDKESEDVQVAFTDEFMLETMPIELWLQNWELANERLDVIDWLFRVLLERGWVV